MRFKTVLLGIFAVVSLNRIAEAATWEIDKSHTEVGFSVKHMVVATVNGRFTDFDGEVNFDPDNLADSKIKGIIKAASINTQNERRDTHLKSAEFFDAETFPEIVFESTKISKNGDTYIAVGNLTIRDVTKEIEIPFTLAGPVKDPWGNTRVGLEGTTTINRLDYNVKWDAKMDNGSFVVSNEVVLRLQAELIQK